MGQFASPMHFAKAVGQMKDELERKAFAETKDLAQWAQGTGEGIAANKIGADMEFSGWQPGPAFDLKIKRLNDAVKGYGVMPARRGGGGAWTVGEIGRNMGNLSSSFKMVGGNRKTGLTSMTKSGAPRKVREFAQKRWNGYTPAWGLASEAKSRFKEKTDRVIDASIVRDAGRKARID